MLTLLLTISMPELQSQLDAIAELAVSLRQAALATRHRRGLIVSGSVDWCFSTAERISSLANSEDSLWVSHQAPEDANTLDHNAVLKRLGSETELLIYDAHGGFDADAFGAAAGLIRAGGLLLLLTPPLDQWPAQHDPQAERFFKSASGLNRFITRLISIAKRAEGIVLISEHAELPQLAQPDHRETIKTYLKGPCRTKDQAQAVDTIVKAATQQHGYPVVLISDRGRGKSSALGIAAAQLLQSELKRIIVTGPRLNSVAPVFVHAHRLLSTASQSRGLIELADARLEYIAPDELIATKPEADLVLVDEAAAIPTPMLTELLTNYQRIVFATTVHGYEGTGRGFALRFNKVLDRQTPGWQKLRLQQPIRWGENDPLEQFVFDALLLNATIATEADLSGLDQSTCQIEKVTAEQLIQDERLLSQIFGLLVLAHYRTRPNDLRQLLDSAGLSLHIIRHRQHIVGVALLIEEGGIDEALGKQVYLGQRRLHGHLLPQSLATHAGILDAPQRHYLRIMRIAIHPAVQGRGLGSKLVRHITEHTDTSRFDCIGTSFGVTTDLFRFWQNLDFVPARLGITREHSSGSYSLLMLTAIDWQDVISFAYSTRGYEFCIAAVTKLVDLAMREESVINKLDPQQQQLLQIRVVQKRSWAEAVSQTGLSGRGAAIARLRQTMQRLAQHFCPDEIRSTIKNSLDL